LYGKALEMKIIAIPIFGSRVSSRLDCSETVLLVYLHGNKVRQRKTLSLLQPNPLEKMNTLIRLGVNVVICGGITDVYLSQLKDSQVHVIPWVRGEVDEILSQFLEGKLRE
jgi:predicted Fe-Mo cluster-binding NifX family protein